LKPRYKRRIFWTSVSVAASAALALVIAPSFINLNNLKPKIEDAVFQQTGLRAKINGDVSFSLIGGATIAARDISLDMGAINLARFSVPLSDMFDLRTAELTGDIIVHGARLNIAELVPPKFQNGIRFRHSVVSFMGQDYEIVRGRLADGMLRGIVRDGRSKYEFDASGDEFHISGEGDGLKITGRLYPDGSAIGALSIDNADINGLLGVAGRRNGRRADITADFDWNGGRGFKFSNIRGDGIAGQIELFDDGRRSIAMRCEDADFDLSFLLGRTGVFHDTALDLDLRGEMNFAGRIFRHVRIDAVGAKSEITSNKIIADDIEIDGGLITAKGSENMPLRLQFNGRPAYCLFSGSPTEWKCSEFSHGGLHGSLSVQGDTFHVFVQSDKKMPDNSDFARTAAMLGDSGRIDFQFSDVGGTIFVDNSDAAPTYRFARDKTLDWLGQDFGFMPDSMRSAIGDFAWDGDALSFVPHSKRWRLSFAKGSFRLDGKNFKDWLPDADLRFMNDFEYEVSGNYRRGNISNLEIRIAGHVFKGTAVGRSITLSTDVLNIDTFVSQDFIDNYDEIRFLGPDPLMAPYALGAEISLSAGTVIYSGNDFTNFVYSLRGGVQRFSITDADRGNLLAGIERNAARYIVTLQLNKFATSGKMLSSLMPLNISDATITGKASFATSGRIAYDFWHNMKVSIDVKFDGGYMHGLGIDGFYAAARDATKLNAEFMLADALDGGVSALKSLRVAGDYDGGDFATTRPFALAVRHADATGNAMISGGKMTADMNLILRGTSPLPAPIAVKISPDGLRGYSLSQIMIDFDPDFFRDFVATHDKF
jgi:hypothetical protein